MYRDFVDSAAQFVLFGEVVVATNPSTALAPMVISAPFLNGPIQIMPNATRRNATPERASYRSTAYIALSKVPQVTHEPWLWTRTTYVFSTDRKITDITEVNIDPSKRLADVDRRNNALKLNW